MLPAGATTDVELTAELADDCTTTPDTDICRQLVETIIAEALTDGGIRVGNEVHFDNGDVVLVPIAAYDDCPYGWACLFNFTSWAGTMWKFQSTDQWQSLYNYGANDAMSSWRNRRNHDTLLNLYDYSSAWEICMESQAAASSVYYAYDNRADAINNTLSDGHC